MMFLKLALFVVFNFAIKYSFAAQSGSSCQTPNSETATCISIYSCKILRDVVKTSSLQQRNFLKDSQCGYDSSPLVCCGSFDNYHDTRSVQKSNQGAVTNNHLPTRNTCGFQTSDRILGGEVTNFDEFPWMVLLQYRSRSTGALIFSCGGTLISSKYILTAAHCVTGTILRKVGSLVSVRLGEWDTDTAIDCVSQFGIEQCNDAPLDIKVEETLAHPSYNDNSINRYNDIALVRLSRAVQYTDYIKPICLPKSSERAAVGDQLIVAGWGATENAGQSSKKLKLEVPVVQLSQCFSRFRSAGVTLSGSQLCAGGVRGKDSCRGDSGGPLMNTINSQNSQWYIEGVVSFGATCGTEGWPGIYTRVSDYVDWIASNVRG